MPAFNLLVVSVHIFPANKVVQGCSIFTIKWFPSIFFQQIKWDKDARFSPSSGFRLSFFSE